MAANLSQREERGSGSGLALGADLVRDAQSPTKDSNRDDEEDEDEEDESEEDEQEPTLKYTKLTSNISWVYRNGDSTSTFLVSGDKMIIGTHGGNVHVLSIPSLQSIRSYHAHSSSITSISVSPHSPRFPRSASDRSSKAPNVSQLKANSQPSVVPTESPKNSPNRQSVQPTLSNAIYIATSSMDGLVCVLSLVDAKDTTIRNYARPVHAVALSPAFKTDRTYLSGGTASNLILTVGGRVGVSADANTNSAAAAASGWLGTIGLGSNTGKDSIIHGNEGTVTSIKWSLSGKFVVWNNEYGTRIMRSHMHLGSSESDVAWKRIAHVPRPNRKIWEDMAGVWKARVEWIDEHSLEKPGPNIDSAYQGRDGLTDSGRQSRKQAPKGQPVERLLIGWGDTVWMVHVQPGYSSLAQSEAVPARAQTVHQFIFSDSIVSGLTLYTPSLLVALVYRSKDGQNKSNDTSTNGTPRRGKQNGLPPDLRLIDLESADKEELEAQSLVVRSFESLSGADYSLCGLYIAPSVESSSNPRGALEALGGGLRDVSKTATRLFSSSASVLSGSSSEGRAASTTDHGSVQTTTKALSKEAPPFLTVPGLKIFIHSQYDCVLAIKRDRSDQLSWLLEHEEYEACWNLVDNHPDIISSLPHAASRPETPSKSGQSMVEFFEDDSSSQTRSGPDKSHINAVEREKQRLGSLWIQQLVSANEWTKAAEVAGKVLGNSQRWSDWILTFAQSRKFDEITPHVPITNLKPPLPSFVYEMILGHYIKHDRVRLQSLLDQWSPTLFDIPSVISAIKASLESDNAEDEPLEEEIQEDDQRNLLNALAKLYLADNNPSAAIRCYVRTRNADEVLSLINEYKMMDAVSDEIFVFILIRISPEQVANAPLRDLDDLSSEPIRLLASAATQGIISPSTVVSQLESKAPTSRPYMFFYFRALWRGDVQAGAPASGQASVKSIPLRKSRFATAEVTNRGLTSSHADLIVTLFAEYSQPLLNEFLKASEDYSLAHASKECRKYHLVPELVLLLQATGQISEALHLIIDELDDVSTAIAFAKDVDDASLWLDLLDYSMDKPNFIRGLLDEVGTSIDPAILVRRIPNGLVVPGLKDSLTQLIRESETTYSITKGASNILNTEVASVLAALRRRRERGLVFNVDERIFSPDGPRDDMVKDDSGVVKSRRGECTSCRMPFGGSLSVSDPDEDREHLIGFACDHLFHLSCLLDNLVNNSNKAEIKQLHKDLNADAVESDQSDGHAGQVGTKVRHAQMIRMVLGDLGCYICHSTSTGPDMETQG